VVDGPPARVRVLPDGCMDLMRMDGRFMVAGPDTTASVSARGGEPFVGLRFHPGVLPRLLGVPASELRKCQGGGDRSEVSPAANALTSGACHRQCGAVYGYGPAALRQDSSANRSTQLPSGSATVA
jgi:hypothetical protein